jgi:hypothetical protein
MDMKLLAAQLRKPEGKTGKEVGIVMNKGNQLINLWTISDCTYSPTILYWKLEWETGCL